MLDLRHEFSGQTTGTRILIVTGKGGVGKTTIAAATAVRAAKLGHRTLLVSTDPAHSLADAFDDRIGPDPTAVAEQLDAQQLDGTLQMERSWMELRSYFADLLGWAGTDGLTTDELLVVPGMQETFALENILRQVDSGRFDRIVVDCAPSAETLRLLELPAVLEWYLDRVFPTHRRIAAISRPFLRRATDMPPVTDDIMDAFVSLIHRLQNVRTMLADPDRTAVRLVTTAEQVVVSETRRLSAHLGLFGYGIDSVVVNRLLGESERGTPLLDHWQERQVTQLEVLDQSFPDLPIQQVWCSPQEPIGLSHLDELGAMLYGESDPMSKPTRTPALTYDRRDGRVALRLLLPGFASADVSVRRDGGELVITAGGHRRAVALPDGLATRPHCQASYDGTELVIDFGED